MTSDSVQRLRALALQKEEIEREIERLVSCLEVTPAGVRGPLVDEDGFPVRTAMYTRSASIGNVSCACKPTII